jgi:hypothetical protein
MNKEKLNTEMAKIDSHRGEKQWGKFFESIDRIFVLDEEINIEMHNTPNNVTELEKELKSILALLEEIEPSIQKLTDIGDEYDAIHNVVYQLNDDDFLYLK